MRPDATHTAKLTWEQVREIRERYAAGDVTYAALGADYGIQRAAVCKIITGRTWLDSGYRIHPTKQPPHRARRIYQ